MFLKLFLYTWIFFWCIYCWQSILDLRTTHTKFFSRCRTPRQPLPLLKMQHLFRKYCTDTSALLLSSIEAYITSPRLIQIPDAPDPGTVAERYLPTYLYRLFHVGNTVNIKSAGMEVGRPENMMSEREV